MSKSRLEWIDIMRAIAIVGVVVFHAVIGNESRYSETGLVLSEHMQHFIRNYTLALLFGASGFFIERWRQKPFKEAARNRFKSIAIPYILWSLILGSIYLVLSSLPAMRNGINNPMTMKDVLLFPVTPLLHLWFLYVMFFMQLAYYGLRKWFSIRTLTAISIVLFYLKPFASFWCLSELCNNFMLMMFGVLWADSLLRFEFKTKHYAHTFFGMVLFLVVAVYAARCDIRNYGILEIGVYQVSVLVLTSILCLHAVALFSMALQRIPGAHYLAHLGRLSMVIYLLHALVTPATRIFMMKLFHIESLPLIIGTSIVMGVFVPVAIHPITKWMRIDRFLFGR